jgi:hypothetical protein
MREDDYGPGSHSGEWSVDETRCNRTYTNVIKIEVGQFDGVLNVINQCGVRIGDTYRFPLYSAAATEQDTGSFAQSIRAEVASEQGAGGITQWKVTVEYGPFDVYHFLGTGYIAQGIVDPTARHVEVYWDSAKYRISRVEDFSDPPLPYRNTAGDPLMDTPEFEETRPVLKIVRNETRYNEVLANYYRDTVNSDVFLGCPPKTVKCRDIKGELHYDPDVGNFYQVTYEFEFRVDEEGHGFTQRILNAGLRYKKNGTGEPVNAVDSDGQQVNDPVLLKEDGDKLPSTDDPYYLEFTEFPEVEFIDLNIPDDIFEADL